LEGDTLDTGTHLVVGLGLAGLAYIDPVIAADTNAAAAVLIGTVLGSQAPDADQLLRIKGNALYIKNHRGLSHSLPAVLIWTALITVMLSIIFTPLPLFHVGLWVFIAVAFHVFSDLFNTYGTQAIRPFSEKWISWNIIHIFDPVIFTSHVIGILLWALGLAAPALIFSILYILIALYYIWRTVTHYILENNLYKQDPGFAEGDQYILIPTVNLFYWNVVKERTDQSYVLGELKFNRLKWMDGIKCADHKAVEVSKQHSDIAAFLYFSSHPCAELRHHPWGFEVRWIDVRYRHRKQYPFVGVLIMDHDYEPLGSYVGWLSDSRLEKKMRFDAY
jgi:inner membrane protein